MNIDGVKMTRTLSSVRRCLAREQMRINATLLALESIGGHKDKMGESAGIEGETLIEEMIGCQVDSCKNLSLRMEYQEKRVEAQTAVVYQFMAQKDSKVMMELAADSKKDSSAMKTISILGMFFLPGTFVAAIFAMPVFDWDATGTAIVKPGFKYFWAVSVPLTALVLLSWAIVTLFPWQSGIANIRERLRKTQYGKNQRGIAP